jgi:hypothetical protein
MYARIRIRKGALAGGPRAVAVVEDACSFGAGDMDTRGEEGDGNGPSECGVEGECVARLPV